jgi:hypothetical protein
MSCRRLSGWFLADLGNGEKEPIGSRIIEVPEDLAQFENRDSHARFIAYVPPGAVKKEKRWSRVVAARRCRAAFATGQRCTGSARSRP